MRRALSLARRGPEEDPNPQVGCVICDPEGRIVAEGWHRGAGTVHAEVDALAHLPEAWRERAADLTVVVTLEPCNHTGRTGPCARALAGLRIGSVVYAVDDAGDDSAGGAESLRAAGIPVLGGTLADEARRELAPWRTSDRDEDAPLRDRVDAPHTAGARTAGHHDHSAAPPERRPSASGPQRARPRRPRIIAKWAQTLDGRAAAENGTSQWITGPEARADVHRRRAEADAILTGTGTVLADDPALTARTPEGGLLVPADEQPIPVVLGNRTLPDAARIRQHPALAAHGLDEPLVVAGDDLEAELSALARYRIYSVFVEAGPRLINSLIAGGLVDELLVYVAPALLGGPKVSIGDLGISDIAEIRRLDVSETVPLGPDLLLKASWHRGSTFPEPIARTFPATAHPREAH